MGEDRMALSCREVVELVSDYLDGTLDEATADQVRAHLQLCDPCVRYVEQMRATADALGRLPVETLPEAARNRLLLAFREYRR